MEHSLGLQLYRQYYLTNKVEMSSAPHTMCLRVCECTDLCAIHWYKYIHFFFTEPELDWVCECADLCAIHFFFTDPELDCKYNPRVITQLLTYGKSGCMLVYDGRYSEFW